MVAKIESLYTTLPLVTDCSCRVYRNLSGLHHKDLSQNHKAYVGGNKHVSLLILFSSTGLLLRFAKPAKKEIISVHTTN